jgi:hypothetical protein
MHSGLPKVRCQYQQLHALVRVIAARSDTFHTINPTLLLTVGVATRIIDAWVACMYDMCVCGALYTGIHNRIHVPHTFTVYVTHVCPCERYTLLFKNFIRSRCCGRKQWTRMCGIQAFLLTESATLPGTYGHLRKLLSFPVSSGKHTVDCVEVRDLAY